jgi:YHS domain-containing protein
MKYFMMLSIFLSALNLSAQSEELRQQHFNLEDDNLAIQGYDPVSYFNNSEPLNGKEEFRLKHRGVIYQFANADNLELFQAQPDKYEPVWGGWCGHAMAQRGEKVAINPTCFKIIEGRNVLFYKTVWANALKNWNKELKTTPEARLMENGDTYWGGTIKSK